MSMIRRPIPALFTVLLCIMFFCQESNACWRLRRGQNCPSQCNACPAEITPSKHFAASAVPLPIVPPGFRLACCKDHVWREECGGLYPPIGYVRSELIGKECPEPGGASATRYAAMYIDTGDGNKLKESGFDKPIHVFLPDSYLGKVQPPP